MGAKGKKLRRGLEKARDALDLPPGILGSCAIEITSNREAVLVGRVAVLEYDEHRVTVRLGDRDVRFEGDSMMISCMAIGGMKVCGDICKIEFVKAV